MGYKIESNKLTNKKNELTDTDNSMVVTGGKGGEGSKGKGVKYMLAEDDLTLGGEHTMQYTDHVSSIIYLKPI